MPQKSQPEPRLHIDQRLPLRWVTLSALPSASQRSAWHRQNEKVVQGLNLLEEGRRPERGEEDGEILQELSRLDLKLSLVLELVGQLSTRGTDVPPPVPVSLGSEDLRWKSEASVLAQGQPLLLEVFLSEAFPMPLRLPAVVASITATSGAKEASVSATYLPLPEPLQEGLEKLIFRRHRRSVAESRHPG